MEKQKTINYFSGFLYFFFIIGAAGYHFESTRNVMLTMTPFILLVFSAIVLLLSSSFEEKKFNAWFFISYVFTFSIEVVGVKTGMLFGSYSYGSILGYKIIDVPLLIGLNWILITLGAINLTKLLLRNSIAISLMTGIICLIFDFVLEPAAMKFNFWNWENNIIPFRNYAVWFLISVLLTFFYEYIKIKNNSVIFVHYFAAQFLFFILLNFF